MENVEEGYRYSFWQFVKLLPFFILLLILGTIKGIIFCPITCILTTLGNAAVILGLWPVHLFWTYYCVLSANPLGPILKIAACPCILIVLILWPVGAIVTSIIGGLFYGFLSPLIATFDSVGEGKKSEVFHCIFNGTWSTLKGCCTAIRDLKDVCYHSYFSFMDDLRVKWSTEEEKCDIRVACLPGAFIGVAVGVVIDVPVITVIAVCKCPYMLFKGLKRLLDDLIGRQGPFLETICVPFAGLAILLWPLAVVAALLASIIASFFIGAYTGVVAYVESSLWMGLRYILASLAIYDEYSNDVLDMPEGSCFPRPFYGQLDKSSQNQAQEPVLSRRNSYRNPPTRTASVTNLVNEFTPLEVFDIFLKEIQRVGECLVYERLITLKDVEDAQSSQGGNGIINIGLPAYCLLRTLIRSAKAKSSGLLLSDNATELTSTNRPKDTFYDWSMSPLLILKDQIEADSLSEEQEDYLSKLILSNGNSDIFKDMYTSNPPASELKRAELEALSRRLRGITRAISRYPTYRRRYESVKKTMLEELAMKNGMKRPDLRSSNSLIRLLSRKSFRRKIVNCEWEGESNGQQTERDLELQ